MRLFSRRVLAALAAAALCGGSVLADEAKPAAQPEANPIKKLVAALGGGGNGAGAAAPVANDGAVPPVISGTPLLVQVKAAAQPVATPTPAPTIDAANLIRPTASEPAPALLDDTHAPAEHAQPDFGHIDDGAACGPHVVFFGDFLYLKERGGDLIFAQPRDGCGANSVPVGPQGILEPNYAPGFRVGGDVFLNNCSALEASFSWWRNVTHASIVAPNGAIIDSLVTLPNTPDCDPTSASATALAATQFRTGDIVFKHLICGQPGCYEVSWLAGGRYAELKQTMHSEFTVLGTTDVDTSINFDGFGPRVGLEGELIGWRGITVYGKGAANFVVGHFGADFNQFNLFAGNQGNIDYRNDRIVPILELELGVGWTSPKGNIRVMGGYYLAAWFNTVTTPDLINGIQANNFTTNTTNLKDTLTFDGLMARLEFRF
jgi:hypothetical protein